MRTTIDLSDEAAEVLRGYARANGITLSRAASILILEGAHPTHRIRYKQGIPVLSTTSGTTITDEDIMKAIEESEAEEAEKAMVLLGLPKPKGPNSRRS